GPADDVGEEDHEEPFEAANGVLKEDVAGYAVGREFPGSKLELLELWFVLRPRLRFRGPGCLHAAEEGGDTGCLSGRDVEVGDLQRRRGHGLHESAGTDERVLRHERHDLLGKLR